MRVKFNVFQAIIIVFIVLLIFPSFYHETVSAGTPRVVLAELTTADW